MKQTLLVVVLALCLSAVWLAVGQAATTPGQTGNQLSSANAKGLILKPHAAHKRTDGPVTMSVSLPEETLQPTKPETAKLLAPHQGGEDIASATVIPSMPYSDTGHTTGYANDYQEDACRGAGISTQPDVVYSYTPVSPELVTINTCASSYNTNIWVYKNNASTLVGCSRFNSTVCGGLRAAMVDVRMDDGNTYYIVIDGDHIAPGSGDYSMVCTSIPAPPIVVTRLFHPTIGDANNNNLAIGYESIAQDDSGLVWSGSADDGQTFPAAGGFISTGYPSYPDIDFWGKDTIFIGTQVGSPLENNGGRVYVTRVNHPTNSATWGQSSWNWSTYGWGPAKAAAIACDTSGEFNQRPGNYAFGIVSWVASTTYTTPDMVDAPHILYEIDTTIAGRATISWYNDLAHCQSTSADIDKITTLSYCVYDQWDTASLKWNLFIRRDLFSNFKDDTQSGGVTYTMGTDTSIGYPSVAAHDGQVLIATEFGTTAAPGDNDIICWYTTGSDYENFSTSVVAATTADERYPRMSHVGGKKFACTYISNNQLYLSTSCDGGINWSTPVVVSGTDVVVNENHASDIGELGQKVIWSYYSNLPTDSAISLHFVETGILFDSDGDCVDDPSDNCVSTPNTDQADADGDNVGDLCDNCPDVSNPGQEDSNHNGIGDACDGCCISLRGNVDGDAGDVADISDLSAMVDFLFFSGTISDCFEENDVDGSLAVDISDLSVLVDFLFFSGTLPTCP